MEGGTAVGRFVTPDILFTDISSLADALSGIHTATGTKFICLAYLTGILPIKKVRTQTALNNFE